MTRIDFPYNLDLKIGDDEELKLIFNELPLKVSFPQSHLLLQKVSSSFNNNSLDAEFNIINGISGLISNLSIEYLQDFFKVHQKYIKVIEESGEKDFNEVYHLKGRPDLMYLIIIKIVEVYYKNFFIGLLENLGWKENLEKMMDKMKKEESQKSTGIFGKSISKKEQTQK